MPRIELWTTVLAGIGGGLAGVLWGGLLASARLTRGTALQPQPEDTAARLLAGSALRAAAGAVLGFLFWLGWGLIALVDLPWFAIGLVYGALSWLALVAPALAMLALRWPAAGRAAALQAVEWLFTCLSIGLFCAWSWHRYA